MIVTTSKGNNEVSAASASPALLNQKSSMFRLSLHSLCALALLVACAASAPSAWAVTLNGSGQLGLPPGCVGDGNVYATCGPNQPGEYPAITNGGNNTFTGQWSANVDPRYGNYFSGKGAYPSKLGLNQFDFSTLNAGFLPAGTILYLGDLDSGSGGNESFTFTARDQNGNAITSPWLESAFYMYSQTPSELVIGSMPEYDWTSPTYLFDGNNVAGNPTVAVYLTTNQDIYGMDVFGTSDFAGFAFGAPTPEPGSLLLLGSGIAGLAGVVRRRLIP